MRKSLKSNVDDYFMSDDTAWQMTTENRSHTHWRSQVLASLSGVLMRYISSFPLPTTRICMPSPPPEVSMTPSTSDTSGKPPPPASCSSVPTTCKRIGAPGTFIICHICTVLMLWEIPQLSSGRKKWLLSWLYEVQTISLLGTLLYSGQEETLINMIFFLFFTVKEAEKKVVLKRLQLSAAEPWISRKFTQIQQSMAKFYVAFPFCTLAMSASL